ncbi:DNA polymerase-4 [Amycolatopsis jiangsuensis]|uniref:DNA polymerase IV n=1 Tax=Amycolatopsis jiangsuensis TaxID=1181879 RepID=A0A840IWM4_9PSEU|nr:DNA polymerase-4 [Amycolatopsis jiangsuensis]
MTNEGPILHADLDAFYASVEQRDAPRLRGRPVIVGGGVVLAASYEAKALGVRTAMGGAQARRLCPQAVVVPPRMPVYSAASKAVFEVFRRTTPVVEGVSIDEAFLDVGGLRRIAGRPSEIATRLRAEVLAQVGLPITVGVARTKFLAKVASAVAKPDGLLVVPPEGELEFLHPLPVERLWGVGKVTSAKLRALGVTTVREVALLPEVDLVSLLGPGAGRHLHLLAHGRDPRAVQPARRRRSMGAQRALGRRRRSRAELDEILMSIVDRLSRRLRAASRVCRTVVLRLRFADFTRATRSRKLGECTDHTATLLAAACALLSAAEPTIHDRGLTLLGLSLTNLDSPHAVQLTLPFDTLQPTPLPPSADALPARAATPASARSATTSPPAAVLPPSPVPPSRHVAQPPRPVAQPSPVAPTRHAAPPASSAELTRLVVPPRFAESSGPVVSATSAELTRQLLRRSLLSRRRPASRGALLSRHTLCRRRPLSRRGTLTRRGLRRRRRGLRRLGPLRRGMLRRRRLLSRDSSRCR